MFAFLGDTLQWQWEIPEQIEVYTSRWENHLQIEIFQQTVFDNTGG
jgi:hypothetical protein